LIPISEQRVERLQGKVGLNVDENSISQLDQRPFCCPGSPTGTVFTTYADHGKEQNFASYEAVEAAYLAGQIQPDALKKAVVESFNALLAPIRAEYAENEEWQEVDKLAYPDGN
jgi:tyrosyl-tRNA synthetase